MKELILGEKTQQARNAAESELMTQLVESFDVEVGEAMVTKECDHLWERESRSIQQQ